jgi:hypothetical protein
MRFLGFSYGALAGFYFGQGMIGWGLSFLALSLFILVAWAVTNKQPLDNPPST